MTFGGRECRRGEVGARRKFITTVAVAMVVVMPGGVRTLGAQQLVVLDARDGSRARAGSVQKSLVAVLGGDEDGHEVGPFFTIARGRQGAYFVSYGAERGRVKVFNASGDYEGVLGGSGRGPGEFTAVSALAAVGDTLMVLDGGSGRFTTFDAELRLIGTAPLRGQPVSAAVLGDGTVVYAADIPTPERVGMPLHLLLPGEYRLSSSFGASRSAGYRFDLRHILYRVLASSGRDGMVWAGLVWSPVIELWNTSTLMRETRLQRVASWFKAGTVPRPLSPSSPPDPLLLDVYEDEEGRLWTLNRVADPEWAEGLYELPAKFAFPGHSAYEVSDYAATYDSVIEVINPADGTLIATHRFDEYFQKFLGEDLAAAYRLRTDGIPVIDIWHLSTTPEGG